MALGERRSHARYEFLAQVQVTGDTEVHILSTANISRGGLCLQMDPEDSMHLPTGTHLELVIFLPDDDVVEEVSVGATVMRTVKGADGGIEGYGLRFESFAPTHLSRFNALLKLVQS